jgi:hypothetical protein
VMLEPLNPSVELDSVHVLVQVSESVCKGRCLFDACFISQLEVDQMLIYALPSLPFHRSDVKSERTKIHASDALMPGRNALFQAPSRGRYPRMYLVHCFLWSYSKVSLI